MKTQGIKTLYRLFAYLSDRTNGFRPFVHYKLMLGALLISLTANACKGKPTPTVPVADPKEQDIEESTCYAEAVPTVSDFDTPKGTLPEVLDDSVAIIMCYAPIIVEETEEVPYDYAAMEAEFPGGENALISFFANNIIYPEEAREVGIEGTVYVKFVVEKRGRVSNIQIISSPHEMLSNEVIRVFEVMHPWIPGRVNGRTASSNFTIPVRFKIEDETNRN